jgi:cellulose synthase operon protein C
MNWPAGHLLSPKPYDMANLRKISIDDLKIKLDSLVDSERRTTRDDYNVESPFIEAAAVIVFYEPETIKPSRNDNLISEDERKKNIFELFSLSKIVVDVNSKLEFEEKIDEVQTPIRKMSYTLRDDVRKSVLENMKRNNRLTTALLANGLLEGKVTNPFQALFTTALLGEKIDLNALDLSDLNFVFKITEWLSADIGFPNMPEREEIRRRMRISEMLVSFKHLTGKYVGGKFEEHFRGRTKELAILRKYVGVAPPHGTLEHIDRTVSNFLEKKKFPLLIHGLGGVGKSTLLAKFLLEHIEAQKNDRFPFVYLDFDRPNLRPDEPESLLIESARQLSIQFSDFPEFQKQAVDFYSKWKLAFSHKGNRSSSLEIALKSDSELHGLVTKRNELRESFSDILKQLPPKKQKKPFLVVLDTFEEVQYKGEDAVSLLYELMSGLQTTYPLMRIVALGRAPVTQFKTELLPLGDLDIEAAVGFLMKNGIQDMVIADQIVKKYGGNPLTLKLAISVYKEVGFDALNAITLTKKQFHLLERKIPEAEIQGNLYDRILAHIRNDEVRNLAHPGLVLRFITPELILNVLAEPCKLPVTDLPSATALFNEMCKEVSLVTIVGPEKIRHVSTVRKVMLKMIEKSEPKLAGAIKKAAIKYYSKKSDLESRAEEIYHRLLLGNTREMIDKRWREGVQDFIIGSADELPEKSQAYLVAKSGLEFANTIAWENVDMEDNERRLTRRIADFLNAGMPGKALEVLKNNKPRSSNTILQFFEIKALLGTKAWDEAMSKAVDLLRSKNEIITPDVRIELVKNVKELYDKGIQFDKKLKTSYKDIMKLVKDSKAEPTTSNLKFKLK